MSSESHTQARSRVAFFLSADSFEGFYGGIFGLDRATFLTTYRNDFVWEYSEGLCRNGHEVVLYILSYGNPELRIIHDGLSVRFLPLPRWFRMVDRLTYRLCRLPGLHSLRDRVAFAVYGSALQRALKDDTISVLYHQEIWTPRFDVVVQRVALPVVGAEHGAVYAPWMEADKRRSLPLAAFLTCQSRENLQRALAFGGKAELFYNGIDTNFFTPPAPNGARKPRTILTVGRLVEEQKRFRDLLAALQQLDGYTLKLVGSGPAEAQLRKTAEQLGLSDRVEFLGFISDRKRLLELYRECSVFVSTSAWEAVALVVLEAMSCEMPVVCTSIPSFEELIASDVDGLLVPVGEPTQVARAIRTAIARTAELGPAARQTVIQRYSSAVLYERLSAVLFRATGPRDRSGELSTTARRKTSRS